MIAVFGDDLHFYGLSILVYVFPNVPTFSQISVVF